MVDAKGFADWALDLAELVEWLKRRRFRLAQGRSLYDGSDPDRERRLRDCDRWIQTLGRLQDEIERLKNAIQHTRRCEWFIIRSTGWWEEDYMRESDAKSAFDEETRLMLDGK